MFARWMDWYLGNLVKKPFLTNSITSGTIAIFGDGLCQAYQKRQDELESRRRDGVSGLSSSSSLNQTESGTMRRPGPFEFGYVDVRRSFIMWSFAVFIGTPFWVLVYRNIDKWFPRKTKIEAVKKGLTTWSIASSTAPFFFTYATIMSNLLLHEERRATFTAWDHLAFAANKVRTELPKTVCMSLCFWCPHWIPLFYLLPPHFRVLYASCVNIGWQALLSFIQHRKPHQPSDSKDVAGGAELMD
jgi:hypothetical protein